MGDVLHALPAVAALRRALPEAYLGWAVEPRWVPLLQSSEPKPGEPALLDKIHEVPTRAWKQRPFSGQTLRDIATIRRALLAERYDICVDLQGSIRSAAIGRMAAAARFLGPEAPREGVAKFLYRTRVATSALHVIEQACELLGAGVDLPLDPASVDLPNEPEASAWCTAMLARVGAGATGKIVLLTPTAGWGAKQWGSERYADLARRLSSAGYVVLVNAAPGSISAEANAIAAGGAAHVVPATLPQLVALTRRAALVIGGDTGPVHLAAALGRPVLALFGPTDPNRNGPYFPGSEGRVTVLRDAASTTDHSRHAAREAGLARLTVDQVEAGALDLLEARLG